MSVTEATLFTMMIMLSNGAVAVGRNVPADRVAEILERCKSDDDVVAVAVEMQDSETVEHSFGHDVH